LAQAWRPATKHPVHTLLVIRNKSAKLRARTGSKVIDVGGETDPHGVGVAAQRLHGKVGRTLGLPAVASAGKSSKDRGHEHDRGKELHRKIRKGGEVVQVEMFGGASFCVVGTMLADLESGGKGPFFIPFE
jgi:hypothetical protein